MKRIHIPLISAIVVAASINSLHALNPDKAATTDKQQIVSTNAFGAEETDPILDAQAREQRKLEQENALLRARLDKELASLRAEIDRLRLERELMALRWEMMQEKAKQDHEQEMSSLNREREKLMAEIAIAQAKLEKAMESVDIAIITAQKRSAALKTEAGQLQAEIEQTKAKLERAKYVDGEATYLKNPLLKDGTLVLSDRSVALNGIITPWKANHVVDRIQYFNNKDQNLPIFIVIESSPGGSIRAGFRILKAMENSQAPIHVVVKAFAASMAACITTLATKSYTYSNAAILHHQPWSFLFDRFNVREQKELYEEMLAWWKRLGTPIAKKMGISLKELDKRFYKKSARGDWSEFGDKAKKLRWVDHVISGIKDSSMRIMPDPANYNGLKYWIEYYWGSEGAMQPSENGVVYLSPLADGDMYYLYNPENRYQIRPIK